MVRWLTWSLLVAMVAVQALAGTCSVRCGMPLVKSADRIGAGHGMAHCRQMASEPGNSASNISSTANSFPHLRVHARQSCSGLPCPYGMTVFQHRAATSRVDRDASDIASLSLRGLTVELTRPPVGTGPIHLLRQENSRPSVDPPVISLRV